MHYFKKLDFVLGKHELDFHHRYEQFHDGLVIQARDEDTNEMMQGYTQLLFDVELQLG